MRIIVFVLLILMVFGFGCSDKEQEVVPKYEITFLLTYDYDNDESPATIIQIYKEGKKGFIKQIKIPGKTLLGPGNYFLVLSDNKHSYVHKYFTVKDRDLEFEIILSLLPDITGWTPGIDEDY